MQKYVTQIYHNNAVFYTMDMIGTVLALGMIFCYFGGDGSFFPLALAFWFSAMVVILMLYLRLFLYGYSIKGNEIVMYINLRKIARPIKDVKCIVVSNAYIAANGIYTIKMRNSKKKRVSCPWFTLVFEDNAEEILRNTVDKKTTMFDGKMTTFDVQGEWFKGKDIFGFVLNKKIMIQLLDAFDGKVVIAKSVVNNFDAEISNLCERGIISIDRIVLIDDLKSINKAEIK